MASSSSSSSNFQSIFDASLQSYNNKTKNKLLDHPLASQLQSCDSPNAVISVLQDLIQQFDRRRISDERLKNWLNPTVNVLYKFSVTLGDGVGLKFPAARVIFAGIGVLLLAAKDVNASQDMLVDLFERIESFFKRLESHTELKPSEAMTDMMVKIMVEVLSVLAIVTVEIKERRRKKFLKRLLGRNDVDDALKRLDKLTQEEAKMATAEVLKITRGMDCSMKVMDTNIKVLIDDGKEARDIMQQENRKQMLRRWLSPPDSSINHNIARKAHYRGTTCWFFQGGIFKTWKSSPSLLWIHGKPGSGKSVLCSGIIEDIMALRETGSACLAYFYCDFRDEEKQSCRHLVLSILSQLAAQSAPCCDILSCLHLAHDGGGRKPSDGALIKCLKEMFSLPTQGPVYLIIDALDECPNHTGLPTAREEVLNLIQDLVDLDLPNVHICVTSRPEIDIRTTLESLTSLCISLHNQTGQTKDIMDYVSSVVHSDKMMQRWRKEDRSLVIKTLSERADGMFRWAYCQLEVLRQCLPPSIRCILDGLPETLDETYERVLKDIKKVNREHAIRLLHCLTVAVRPLRVEELAEVLAIDFDAAGREGIPKLNPNWRWADQHQAVLSTCSSLIAIVDDGDSQVVQFSHFSVKEYLTSDRLANANGDVSRYHILPESAHTILAQACLGVVLRFDDHVDKDAAKHIPLAVYAAEHWVEHARFKDVSSRILDAMEYLFDEDNPHLAAWIKVHNFEEVFRRFPFSPTKALVPHEKPLYYASFLGFYDLAKHLVVKHPEHVNARGGWFVSPLGAALYGNHLQVAELLYEHGADVHVRSDKELTLLHWTSREGCVDAARWLLNHGAESNAQGDDGTPLLVASHTKHPEIVQMLLEHHADVHAQNAEGAVALHLAASCHICPFGCFYESWTLISVLQLLLDHGADVNARDNKGWTPLHHSSFRGEGSFCVWGKGSVEAARLLLDNGANIDVENNEGDTPFLMALQGEHHKMAEFLWGLGTMFG